MSKIKAFKSKTKEKDPVDVYDVTQAGEYALAVIKQYPAGNVKAKQDADVLLLECIAKFRTLIK